MYICRCYLAHVLAVRIGNNNTDNKVTYQHLQFQILVFTTPSTHNMTMTHRISAPNYILLLPLDQFQICIEVKHHLVVKRYLTNSPVNKEYLQLRASVS